MSEALTRIISETAINIDGRTVTIELICSNVYGAHIVFDDIRTRIASNEGLKLLLRGCVREKDAAR